MITKFVDNIHCCGCRACEQICPKHAISMSYDEEGFIMPTIDTNLCIECTLCENVCPINKPEKTESTVNRILAAINKDTEVLKQSSSGGIFSVIAEYILSNKGIVYGAAFNDQLVLSHIGVETLSDLPKLRGSKYLQSDNNNIYTQIKSELKKGRLVYYTGTGCQVAGLKLFLQKEYKNLITSDLICHGTPSQKMFNAFIHSFEKKHNSKIVKYDFRDKKVGGWSCSQTAIGISQSQKRHYYSCDKTFNADMDAFMTGSINRESCYYCPFASKQRSGDITLADYWGIKKFHPDMDSHMGASVIMINTQTGENIISQIKNKILLKDTNIDWVAELNHNLTHATIRPFYRNKSYKDMLDNPEKFINQFIKKDYGKKYIYFLLKRLLLVNDTIYKRYYTQKNNL